MRIGVFPQSWRLSHMASALVVVWLTPLDIDKNSSLLMEDSTGTQIQVGLSPESKSSLQQLIKISLPYDPTSLLC